MQRELELSQSRLWKRLHQGKAEPAEALPILALLAPPVDAKKRSYNAEAAMLRAEIKKLDEREYDLGHKIANRTTLLTIVI